jgi:hypothetical protein
MCVPALLVAAAVLTTACDIKVGNGDFSVDIVSGKAQDEWSRTYTLKRGAKIHVINTNGRIDVQPNDGPSLDVRAERIAKARSDEAAKAVLEKVEILEVVNDAGVTLQTKLRERLSMGQHQEVRYHLKVPAGMSIEVTTSNGGVELSNLDATIIATTTNGGVTARNGSGSIEASTTTGGVNLDLAAIGEGGVKAETVNGSVRLRVPYDLKANLNAQCVNGGISVDNVKLDPSAERTRRRVEGTINGGGPPIRVDTTNGAIRISSWSPETVTLEKSAPGR